MEIKQIAALLDGRQYTDEITPDIMNGIEGTGIVIVFGASDDLMEFRGAINDGLGCYDGGKAYLDGDGLIESKCDEGNDCPYFKDKLKSAIIIEAVWDGEEPYSWTYRTDIPHSTFNIHEDDELYCRGIIFHLDDVMKPREEICRCGWCGFPCLEDGSHVPGIDDPDQASAYLEKNKDADVNQVNGVCCPNGDES